MKRSGPNGRDPCDVLWEKIVQVTEKLTGYIFKLRRDGSHQVVIERPGRITYVPFWLKIPVTSNGTEQLVPTEIVVKAFIVRKPHQTLRETIHSPDF
jgi:hypothetical protein